MGRSGPNPALISSSDITRRVCHHRPVRAPAPAGRPEAAVAALTVLRAAVDGDRRDTARASDQLVLSTSSDFNTGRVDYLREVNGVWTRMQTGPYPSGTTYAAANRAGTLVAVAARQTGTVQILRWNGTTWGTV